MTMKWCVYTYMHQNDSSYKTKPLTISNFLIRHCICMKNIMERFLTMLMCEIWMRREGTICMKMEKRHKGTYATVDVKTSYLGKNNFVKHLHLHHHYSAIFVVLDNNDHF